MGILLTLFLLVGVPGLVATPIATPSASPIAKQPCAGVPEYFVELGDLLQANNGYFAVRDNPAGTFGLPADETIRIARSLDDLIADIEAIEPPVAAALFHLALIDQIDWYRDLVVAPDLTTHQRIINRDKQLVPAMSRAMISGQSACGYDDWTDAYGLAFGDN